MANQPKPEIEPVVPIWPDAGKALGYRSKSAAYDAARKGIIPVIRLGPKLQRVSRRWLAAKTAGELG
jgi:hypothetical protein